MSCLCFHGCIKTCKSFHYKFNGDAIFYPEADSVKIGDTVWFNSKIPTQLVNQSNGQMVDYSNASNFATDFHITPISGVNPFAGGVDSFKFVPKAGVLGTNKLIPHAAKTLYYLEQDGFYQLLFGMVALRKGVYAAAIIDIQNSKKKCSDAFIAMSLSNTNKHQSYLQQIYYPGSPFGDTIPLIEQTHTYSFKVY